MELWWRKHVSKNSLVIREELSQTTAGNAFHTAALCRGRGDTHLLLVTCDYHLARARRLFERSGLEITPAPAPSPHKGAARLKLVLREIGAGLLSPWEKFA